MSLTLTVDGDRWRAHLRAVAEAHPGLVPVAKGNGYGFGLGRLARKAAWLGCDTLAVGTYSELPEVAGRFPGDLLVMTPWRPFGAALEVPADLQRRVVHTVSRMQDVRDLQEHQPGARFVLELVTSMLRHGLSARELRGAAAVLDSGTVRRGLAGVALHLPLSTGSHLAEVHRLVDEVVAAGLADGRRHDHLGLAPHRRRARPAAHHARRLRHPARASAPSSGSATGRPWRSARPSSTCTRSSGETCSATAGAAPRSPATSSSSAAGRPTASASRRRPATPR